MTYGRNSPSNDEESAVDTAKLEAAAESSFAKWSVRIVFGICAFLAMNKLNSMDASVGKVVDNQSKQDVKIAEINGKVDRLDTKMDSAVLYQVEDLKKRVERIEAATKTP